MSIFSTFEVVSFLNVHRGRGLVCLKCSIQWLLCVLWVGKLFTGAAICKLCAVGTGDRQKALVCYSRVPSKRVAMVSRKVFWGASSPLITGILLRVDWVLLPRRPGPAALDSCWDPKLGRKREVPGAHPSPWRSAPIRDTRGDSTLAPWGLWP